MDYFLMYSPLIVVVIGFGGIIFYQQRGENILAMLVTSAMLTIFSSIILLAGLLERVKPK